MATLEQATKDIRVKKGLDEAEPEAPAVEEEPSIAEAAVEAAAADEEPAADDA